MVSLQVDTAAFAEGEARALAVAFSADLAIARAAILQRIDRQGRNWPGAPHGTHVLRELKGDPR